LIGVGSSPTGAIREPSVTQLVITMPGNIPRQKQNRGIALHGRGLDNFPGCKMGNLGVFMVDEIDK